MQKLTRENQERRAQRYQDQRLHWQLFNFLARFVGCGFIFAGVVFSIWGISILLDSKATIGVNGVPTTDPWVKGTVLIAGLVALVLGTLLVTARRYRPDLGDSAFTISKKTPSDETEKSDKTA